MKIAEIFGPTIQGEGSVIGMKTMFIRVAGCDYRCSWCDSGFAQSASNHKEMTPGEVFTEVMSAGAQNFNVVTITGGNPCVVGEEMKQLIELFHLLGIMVQVETQGSIWQDWLLDCDVVAISPKPPSAMQMLDLDALILMANRLDVAQIPWDLKIVVFDDTDYTFAKNISRILSHLTPSLYLQVGNHLVGNEDKNQVKLALLEKLEWLVNKVLVDPQMNDVTVLPQLHTLIWGNRQGV